MWQIYKYQPLNKITLSNLAQNKLWACKPYVFNDPFEFRLKRKWNTTIINQLRKENPQFKSMSDEQLFNKALEQYQENLNNMGVVCFSSCPDNMLMWSHYSDEHRGLVLGFCSKEDSLTLQECGLYPVQYEREYPEIDFEKVWHKDGLARIIWTKSINWEYEEEVRRIMVEGNLLVDYPGKFNKVIFGLRTSSEDMQLVRTILKDENDIEFYKVSLHDEEYKLIINRI